MREIQIFALIAAAIPATAFAQEDAVPVTTPAPTATTRTVPAPTPVFGDVSKEVTETTAPAFSLMGVQGETITAPEGLKKFGLAVLNGVNQDDDEQSGIGIQFAPAQLLSPGDFSYDQYSKSYLKRALARFSVNLALVQSRDETHPNAVRGAAGFTWVAFDTTDPFANEALGRCLAKDIEQPTAVSLLPGSDAQLGPQPEGVDAAYQKSAENCRKLHNRTASDGYSAQIGFAKTFFSESGKPGGLKGAGFGVNGVVSIGLNGLIKPKPAAEMPENPGGLDSRILIGALYRDQEKTVDPADKTKFTTRDRFSVGGRLLIGSDRGLMFGFEALHEDARYASGLRDRYTTYNATIDIKIADKLWLNAGYGGSNGKVVAGTGTTRFSGGLRYSLGPKAVLGSGQ